MSRVYINRDQKDQMFASFIKEQADVEYKKIEIVGEKKKKSKYRPFVCKVYGILRGQPVVQAFKSEKAAHRFIATLSKGIIVPLL